MAIPARKNREFDPSTFLATIGEGRKSLTVPKKQGIFAQGDPADAVFYIQKGKVRLAVVSKTGKEATIGILGDGNFFGEGSLAGQGLRMGSAGAMGDCILLMLAHFGKEGIPDPVVPKISQEPLAEMVGTTRSRVSFFMNRFRKLGFIDYNERTKVNKSLLNVVLLDQLQGHKAEKPAMNSLR